MTGTRSGLETVVKCQKVSAQVRVAVSRGQAEWVSNCESESITPVIYAWKRTPVAEILKQLSATEVAPPDGSPGVIESGVGEKEFLWSELIAQRDAAMLQEAAKLKARLSRELDDCLKSKERKLLDKAEEDATGVGPLLSDRSVLGRTIGEPEIRRYIDKYNNATVRCDNALGTRTILVTVPEVAMMEDWLQAPAVGLDNENHPPPSYQAPHPLYKAPLPPPEEKIESKTSNNNIAGPVILFLSLPSVSFALLGVGHSFEQQLKKSAYGMSTGEYQATRAKANWAYGTGYVGLGISTVVLFSAF